MATFVFTGQSTTSPTGDQTIGATDKLRLCGVLPFGTPITEDTFNVTTHVTDASDVEKCTSVHINNTKYVSSSQVNINEGGAETLGASVPLTSECPLKVVFSHATAVAITNAAFWCHGATETDPPTEVTFYALEQGDTAWTAAEGTTHLGLTDQSAATSHTYYIALSAAPDEVGTKTATMKFSLTYQ